MSTPMPRPAPVTRTTFFSDMFGSSSGGGGPSCGLSSRSRRHPGNTGSPRPDRSLRRGVLAGTPSGVWAGPTLEPWTTRRRRARRSASSSPPAARGSPPTDAGLPPQGTRRRVKGLRREEVALLAGVSPEYYVRLERGQATGPSAGVVDAVADVLRLDDDERAHLGPAARRPHPRGPQAEPGRGEGPGHPGVRVLLDALDHLPAVVFNGRLDLLAVNALGRALYAPVYDLPGRPNSARFLFLDEPRARDLFPEWDRIAGDTVAILRIEAGRHPDDPELIELIGQLSTRSAAFRTRWAGQRRPGAPGRHQGLPAPAHRRGHAAVREPARRRRLRPGAHRLHPAARQPRSRRDPPAGQLERRQRAEGEPDNGNRQPDTRGVGHPGHR